MDSPEYEAFWRNLNCGEFVSGRFARIDSRGETVWLLATYNPLFDAHGRLYGVIKLATNITAQVLQRQRETRATLLAQDIARRTSETARSGEQAVAGRHGITGVAGFGVK